MNKVIMDNVMESTNKSKACKIYEYVKRKEESLSKQEIEQLEDAIVTTRDARYIYFNVEYIYRFAKDVIGANIEKLEDVIIATERPRYIYEFAKNVEGANIPKLTSVIFKAENMHYVYPFIMNVLLPNFDKKEKKKNKVNGNGTQKIKRR